MGSIFGEDREPKIPFPSKILDNLYESSGIKKPSPDDPNYTSISEVFEIELGKTYNPDQPFMYPTQSRGINTEALYHNLFINIGAIIGNVPGNESIGSILKTIQSKIESNIDPNVLLNIIAKILGPGIFNNGFNGSIVNISNTTEEIDFIITSIDAIIMHNKVAIYKNIGNANINIRYSDKATPNTTQIYKYSFVVKNIGTTAYDYVKSIPTVDFIDDADKEVALFLVNQEELTTTRDQYIQFITNGEIVELYEFYVDLGTTSNLVDFRTKRLFIVQNANNFAINQLREAMSGNAATLEFPKDMVITQRYDTNDDKSYITRKMGEIIEADPVLDPNFAIDNPVVILDDFSKELTDDEKVLYPEYVNQLGTSVPAKNIDFKAAVPSFRPGVAYPADAVIFLEPTTYTEEVIKNTTYPYIIPISKTSLLGKKITYYAETRLKRYRIRLRSLIDNNTFDPNEDYRYIGVYWAVDCPKEAVEIGKNARGEYVVYADGTVFQTVINQPAIKVE